MRYTGIIRKLDNLGRVVLPAEMRRVLDIKDYDEVEMFLENDTITVRKYQPACLFCGSTENLAEFHGRKLCAACREEIVSL